MTTSLLYCSVCHQRTIRRSEVFEGQRTSWYECPEHGREGAHR